MDCTCADPVFLPEASRESSRLTGFAGGTATATRCPFPC